MKRPESPSWLTSLGLAIIWANLLFAMLIIIQPQQFEGDGPAFLSTVIALVVSVTWITFHFIPTIVRIAFLVIIAGISLFQFLSPIPLSMRILAILGFVSCVAIVIKFVLNQMQKTKSSSELDP